MSHVLFTLKVQVLSRSRSWSQTLRVQTQLFHAQLMTQASYLVTLYLNSFFCIRLENNSIYPHLFVTQIELINIYNTQNNDIHNTLRTMHGT